MAAGGGAGIALLIAYLVERLDDRLLSGHRAERLTGLRYLGTGRSIQTETKDADSFGTPSELQRLTANILSALGHPYAGAILVTGTDSSHGTTNIAVELAASIGRAGKRVILVDANLAQPTQQNVPDADSRNGLTWLLTHAQIPLPDNLVGTGTPGVYVLQAGPSSRNAMELLASERMELCVTELRLLGDVVIFDGPLSLALAARVDGVVLVTDARTRAEEVVATAAILQGTGANVLGLVLNARAQTNGLLPTGTTTLSAVGAGELTRS
jgi:Mrp family chromosome partitioning ATPase